jgi:hypothetical protein
MKCNTCDAKTPDGCACPTRLRHPCAGTCSGYTQGYEDGQLAAPDTQERGLSYWRAENAKLRKALVEIVEASGREGLAGDHRWKIASRALEAK